MMGNNQNLFFSPEEKGREFSDVLKEVQEYISSKYSTLMVEGGNEEVKQQVKRYISNVRLSGRMSALWNQYLCGRCDKFRQDYSGRVAPYHHSGQQAYFYH